MVDEVKSRYHIGAAQDLKQPMRFSLKFPFIVWPVARLVYIPPPPISPFLNLPFDICKYTWKTCLTTRSLSDQPWMCRQVRMNVAHRLGSPGHGRGPSSMIQYRMYQSQATPFLQSPPFGLSPIDPCSFCVWMYFQCLTVFCCFATCKPFVGPPSCPTLTSAPCGPTLLYIGQPPLPT